MPEMYERPDIMAECLRPTSMVGKPHIRYVGGRFRLYRSFWKSLWPTATAIPGGNITQLQATLARCPDANRSGYMNGKAVRDGSFNDLAYYSRVPWR